ncbi:M16 family metallopeptidase [Anianabacter salinae]|uniref:M16 family metallopeptidase n=1 Tax=Anianabacter salinae TaxID=2851023 RepID=UPI00225E1B7E|nr:pitrilysin family protein [Anianabacter salinae]MBV0911309.1 insulinase family protein [Anianabacter salinae]
MTVQITTLPNGFRVVSEHMPALHSTALGLWVNAGGRHERLEQNGIAHFLEHMAFKGTKTRTALQIAEEIEDVGGYINAYTSREMTAYYARVLEADAGLALDVISDIVLNPVFDDREIEVERGVILQEIGQVLDTPDDVVFDWLQEVAYPDQALGRSILGPTERVSGFKRDDLSSFVSEHYGPDRMILAAAGAIDHDWLVREAEKLFSHLPRGAGEVTTPAKFQIGERRETKTLEQVHFALAFEAPGYRDLDIYTAQVYSTALGGGMSSRLFQEIRENRGLCYTIFAQSGAYADTGMTTIYAGTSGKQLGELADLTATEIRRAADDMTEAEVARARAQLKAGLLIGLESPSSRAERLARLVSIWDRVPTIEETIAHIEAVGREDVLAFARRTAEAPAALTVYGPDAKRAELDAIRQRLAA